MKKSILMAIVAIALLAAPVFAGDASIGMLFKAGFSYVQDATGTKASGLHADSGVTFTGAVDDFNTIQFRFNTSGSPNTIGTTWKTAKLTTDVFGAFGLTDIPVTLKMTNNIGGVYPHFWDQGIGTWTEKDSNTKMISVGGTYGLSFDSAIMDIVNVRLGVNMSDLATPAMLASISTSGLAFGPVSVGVAVAVTTNNASGVGDMGLGGKIDVGVDLGMIKLTFVIMDMMKMDSNDANQMVNNFAGGLKASGAMGDIGYGANLEFMAFETTNMFDTMNFGFDAYVSYAVIKLKGGVMLNDIVAPSPATMKTGWTVGVDLSVGAATIGVGASDESNKGPNVGASPAEDKLQIYFNITASL
jgi:hypothetical protein